jgi:Tfp pilus assembly protein PilN
VINLLPPEIKQEYRYARHNRQLVHWSTAFLFAIIGVAIITGAGVVIMNNSINSYDTKVADMKSRLSSEDNSGVERQVSDISNNLKLMVDVLSKELLFSKLLEQLGTITPSNVILTSLSISQSDSAIDITAQTTNYNAATQLQVNLAAPGNQIFSSADIVNITCASDPTTATYPNYPCTATLRAQFTNNNPFLFINSKTQKTGSSNG